MYEFIQYFCQTMGFMHSVQASKGEVGASTLENQASKGEEGASTLKNQASKW